MFPYGAPRKKGYGVTVSELRFSVLSLSLYLPNSFFVFSAFQWFCNIRRTIRRLAPQGAKLFASLEHESLRSIVREVLLRFLMARHANRDTVFGNVDFLPLSFQYFCLCKIVSTSAGSAKTPFVALFPFRRAIRRLAPQGGKALHSALRAPLEHESLRTAVRE